jgi:hypothetical protein
VVNNIDTLLFVEGPNDKGFVSAFIKLKLPTLDANVKIVSMDGLGNFAKSLKSFEADIKNKGIKSVGIIIDKDNKTQAEKIAFVNGIFKETDLFKEVLIDEKSLQLLLPVNKHRTVTVSLFLMQDSNGQGELIDLLKEIKLSSSETADCIIACIKQKEDSEKVRLDDWLHFYLKWDSSTKKEREVSNKIGLDKTETKERLDKIFDLDAENNAFQNLKNYLKLFST